MIVRELQGGDITGLIKMGGEMHRESVYHTLPFEPLVLRELGGVIIQNPTEIGGFVAVTEDGDLAGQMIVCRQKFFFNSLYHCSDIVLYVAQPYRGTSAAIRLIRRAELWAKMNDCIELRFGESAQINPDAVHRMFKKLGYEPNGTLYTKLVH